MSSSPPPDNAPAALDLDALEAKAKNALTGEGHDDMRSAWDAFSDACDPDTVLELIRRLRRYSEALEDVRTLARQSAPPVGDGTEDNASPWFGFWVIANHALAALGSPGEEGEPAE